MTRLRILVICTANACRSPVVERLTQRYLDQAGIAADVRSAGTQGGTISVHRHTRAAAAEHGIDLRGHNSRLLTNELIDVEGRDLIITMTRQHLYDVVALDPSAFGRTFTLRELVRRSVDRAPSQPIGDLGELLVALTEGRNTSDLLPGSPDDDITDPYGGPKRGHRAMVTEVDSLLAELVEELVRNLRPGEPDAEDT